MRRIGIYLIYDQHGVVDDYCIYYLKELKKILDYLLVVSNGPLNDTGVEKINQVADELFIRENYGYDAWAYKESLEHIGWEKIGEYDELVITNYTVYGPFYPFQEAFDDMEHLAVDFWGMFLRREDRTLRGYGGRIAPYGYIPEFVVSNFCVIRSRLLHSEIFQTYWEEIPPINDYIDACNLNEPVFTKKMFDAGYRYATYDTVKGRNLHYDFAPLPPNMKAYDFVKKYRVPIVRRKAFYAPYQETDYFGTGKNASNLLRFIQEYTDYDINLIYDNLLRTTSQYEYRPMLSIDRALSSTALVCSPIALEKKAAVIFYCSSLLYIEKLLEYMGFFSASGCDIYLIFGKESDRYLFENTDIQQCCHYDCKILTYDIADKTGILIADIAKIIPVEEYQYLCIINNINKNTNRWKIAAESQLAWCWDSLAESENYIYNVLDYFEQNPRIGVLCPLSCVLQKSGGRGGENWDGGFQAISQYAPTLELTIPISAKFPPAAPFEHMFWCRTESLKEFWNTDWSEAEIRQNEWALEETEEKRLRIAKGNLMKFMDKLLPLYAQQSGYMTAYITSETLAMIEINKYKNLGNLSRQQHQRELRQVDIKYMGIRRICKILIHRLKQKFIANPIEKLKQKLKNI